MEPIPEPTLRIVVVAPLAPPPDQRTGAAVEAGALGVDAAGLDALVARCAGTLHLRLANRLAAAPAQLDVALPITSLAAFKPEAVAAQIAPLAPWLALRGLLGEAAAGKLTVEQLLARAQAEVADRALVAEVAQRFGPGGAQAGGVAVPSPATERAGGRGVPPGGGAIPAVCPATAGGAVDAILALVDLPAGVSVGEAAAPPPANAVARLAAAWGGGRGHRAEGRQLAAACAALDPQISAQLDEVFGDPHFRALEAAWRGIAWLVRRLGRCAGVRLEVVAATPGEEAAAVRAAVVEPWYAGAADVPPALVVVARPFDASPPSLALLAELAALGEEVQAGVVVEVGDDFFGPEGLASISSLAIHLAGDPYAGWRSLRDKEASGWLAAVYNRVCLCAAHGDDPGRAPFRYREAAGPLWGSPALVVALLAGDAFGATAWPGPVAGEVGELPLAGDRATAAAPSPAQVATLADHGIVALAPIAGRDRVRLAPAVTVHRPRHWPAEPARLLERARADFSYPLVVGQLAALLHHLTPGFAGRPDGAVAAATEAAFRGRLGEGAGLAVELSGHPERPDRRLLRLAITPPAPVLASQAPVEMAVAIPR